MRKSNRVKIVVLLILFSIFLLACRSEKEPIPTLSKPPVNTEDIGTQPPPEIIVATPEQPITVEDIYSNTDPTGQVITFWHPYTGNSEAALLDIIQEFNLSNEWNITVAAEYQGNQDDIFDKMLTFMNSAEAPNLVVAQPHQATTYHLGDALVDLNPMVYSPKWGLTKDEIEDYVPGIFYQDVFPNFGNIRLGFPIYGSMEVLFYNADWLRELGVEAPPKTPEDFKAVACAATKQPYSNATAEGSIGNSMNIDATLFASWVFAYGGQLFDNQSNHFTYDSPEAVAAMQLIQTLFPEGCARQIGERNGDLIEFSQGTALFTLGSSDDLIFYQNGVAAGSNHHWSVAPVPHTTAEPVQNISGTSVSIAKTSPEAQLAAWLFLKFFTNPEVQAKWAQASGFLPVRNSVAAGLGDYFAAHPAYATAFEMMSLGVTEPPAAGYEEVRNMVTESMYAISQGADVNNVLTSLNADANTYLEEQLSLIPEIPDSWANIDPSGQTIVFWHQQSPVLHATLEDLIWKFNSTNQWGITVVPEYKDNIIQAFQTALDQDGAPNLIELFQSQTADFQLDDTFTDMTPLVESIKWGLTPEEQTDFFPGIYAQDIYPTFDHARLGFPLHRSLILMYYNADWLAELRSNGIIDFDGPPRTPEEFEAAACAAASNPFSQSLTDTNIGFQLNINASHFAGWTFAHGGNVFDDENVQYNYNDEADSAAISFLKNLLDDNCASIVVERYEDQINFSLGATLFTIGSTSGLSYYQEDVNQGAQFNWSVAPIPYTTDGPVVNAYGTSLNMAIAEPESQLATWLFIKYLTTPEVQAAWAQSSNYFPVRASAAEGLADLLNTNPLYAAGFNLMPYAIIEPSVPGYEFVQNMVEEAMAAIIEGEDIQPTLDQLNKDANVNLAEQLVR